MNPIAEFQEQLKKAERKLWKGLTSPWKIQEFLDRLPYRSANDSLCPLSVLRRREAHCFDGAVFAAAALRRLGHKPRITYLTAQRDDDHLLALYQIDGYWGAVSKSNYTGLRFRDPVYRTLRELIMSYFEPYYNIEAEKTLRRYTAPLSLESFDKIRWMSRDEAMEPIDARLDTVRSYDLITRNMVRRLSPVDRRSYRAGLLGANMRGVYKP